MKLRTLQEILTLNKDDFNTTISYQIEIVSIYLDIDPELLWDEDIDYIINHYNIVQNILFSETNSKDEVIIDGIIFKKMPFNQLTLGEFIDLDYYSKHEDGIINIIMILYRRSEQKDKFSPIEFEKYYNFFNNRREYFLDLDIRDVLGIKTEFDSWKNQLYDNYKGLFEIPYEEEYEEDENSISVKQAKQKENQKSQFNWESTILSVVNNDITKVEDVLKMSIILFFNLLSSIKINN